MKKLFLFFISLFLGMFLQNASSMDRDKEESLSDISRSVDMDEEEGLTETAGQVAYENAFSVLRSVIEKSVCKNKTKLNGSRCIYYLKTDISKQDFEKIKKAFKNIKSTVKKKSLDNKIVLIITLNEKYRWFKE